MAEGKARSVNVIVNQFIPPVSNTMWRTVLIHCDDQGTGFFIDHDGFQYLLTAHHIVSSGDTSKLRLMLSSGYVDFPCVPLHVDKSLDIAVLRPPHLVDRRNFPARIGMANLAYGQHVYFLGFPYGDFGAVEIFGQGKWPIPFVKWAGVANVSDKKFGKPFVLDGINNPGFSGGPVCYNNGEGGQDVCGMIIGLKEEERVADLHEAVFEGSFAYKQNTGLIFAVSASQLSEAIEKSGKGVPIE